LTRELPQRRPDCDLMQAIVITAPQKRGCLVAWSDI
jgi:hypothetical protein